MKINTNWSQDDWNKALEKVWKLSKDFEEILNFGLDHGFISSSDIIHASDIYRDPNKEYDEYEIEEFVKSVSLSDLMTAIQDKYSLDDIIRELPSHEILENFDKSDLLEELDRSWELDQHDEEVKEEAKEEVCQEFIEDENNKYKEYLNDLYDDSDKIHKFICDLFNVTYYDQNVVNKFINMINNNSYNIDYTNIKGQD